MKEKIELLKAVRSMIRVLKERKFNRNGRVMKLYLGLERDLRREIAGL